MFSLSLVKLSQEQGCHPRDQKVQKAALAVMGDAKVSVSVFKCMHVCLRNIKLRDSKLNDELAVTSCLGKRIQTPTHEPGKRFFFNFFYFAYPS